MQVLLSGNVNLNMSQQWKVFKQLYYRNLNILSLCISV